MIDLLKLPLLKEFIGKKVIKLLIFSTIVGFILFLIESSFVFVLQLFLHSLHLLSSNQLMLPEWMPKDTWFAASVLLVFGVSRGVIYMVKVYLSGLVGQEFIKHQREHIIGYCLNCAYDLSINEVVTIFTERVGQAGSFLQFLAQLVLVLTSSILFFLGGLKIAPVEMLLGVFLLLAFLFPLKYLNKIIIAAGAGLRDEWVAISSTLISGLKNYFFLRVYNLIPLEVKKITDSLEHYRDHYGVFYKISAFKNYSPNIIGIFIVSFITYISVTYIHTNGVLLVSFFYIFIKFAQGVSELNNAFSELILNRPNFLELKKWFDLQHSFHLKTNNNLRKKIDKKWSDSVTDIKIENVSFAYPQGPQILSNINQHLKMGDILLIKGESGSGKSTLAQLLLGILEPVEGTITINNIDVHKYQIPYAEFVGYVGPEPYLTIGTLRENLCFGNDLKAVTDSDLEQALKFSCLNIKEFPLDLKISEYAALSTGQKQRLAIARAILRKPRLLVLDEATANLDIDTEMTIIKNLSHITNDILTVIISHKSTFDDIATYTLNMDKGYIDA